MTCSPASKKWLTTRSISTRFGWLPGTTTPSIWARTDDEERSAQLAEADLAALGVDPRLVAEVARLVRLTISHQPGHGDRNGEVLSDADLAALGVEPRRYRANSAAIRAEYAHVPDNDFRARRARVVRTLLSGPAVFYTPLARSRWESQARANLTDELRALEQP